MGRHRVVGLLHRIAVDHRLTQTGRLAQVGAAGAGAPGEQGLEQDIVDVHARLPRDVEQRHGLLDPTRLQPRVGGEQRRGAVLGVLGVHLFDGLAYLGLLHLDGPEQPRVAVSGQSPGLQRALPCTVAVGGVEVDEGASLQQAGVFGEVGEQGVVSLGRALAIALEEQEHRLDRARRGVPTGGRDLLADPDRVLLVEGVAHRDDGQTLGVVGRRRHVAHAAHAEVFEGQAQSLQPQVVEGWLGRRSGLLRTACEEEDEGEESQTRSSAVGSGAADVRS